MIKRMLFKFQPLFTITCIFLAAFLTLSSYQAWIRVGSLPEVPWGCDLFGHLRIAHEIRTSIYENQWPNFRFEHPQVSELIRWFQASGAPVFQWEEMVGPQAHHYVERSQSVVDQYPPGAGGLMALFPKGKGVEGLNRLAILISLILGLLFLGLCWKQSAWISIGMTTLASFYTSYSLEQMGLGNYSVNAMILPVMFVPLFNLAARSIYFKQKYKILSQLIAFLAGSAGGLSCLIRIPSALQVAGWPLFLPYGLWISYGLGVLIFGLLPLGWYHQSTTGAWWATTYNTIDATLPNWKAIGPNIRFYLLREPGLTYFVWPLLIMIGFWGWTQISKNLPKRKVENQVLWRTAAWLWGVNALYLLSHDVAVSYYMLPAHLTLVWFFAGGTWLQQQYPLKNYKRTLKRSKQNIHTFVKLLSLVPLFTCLILGGIYCWHWAHYLNKNESWPTPIVFSIPAEAFNVENIPSELIDQKAWVWSDLTDGAFWLAAKKPAFRMGYRGSREMRAALFLELRRRHEPQFLIMDGSASENVASEYKDLGAFLESRGKVFGFTYYRINWNHLPG